MFQRIQVGHPKNDTRRMLVFTIQMQVDKEDDDAYDDLDELEKLNDDDDDDDDEDEDEDWLVGGDALESNRLPLQPSIPILPHLHCSSVTPPTTRHGWGHPECHDHLSWTFFQGKGEETWKENPSHASPETTIFGRVSVSCWGHATA